MKYEFSQNFNSGKAKNYLKLETDSATMIAIVALCPKGGSVFNPTATGAQGTARPLPQIYKECKVICSDSNDGAHSSAFVNVKYGKPTLKASEIVTICSGKVEVPNGTSCDKARVKNLKKIS